MYDLNKLNGVGNILQELVSPGYKVNIMYSAISANIDIRIYNTNKNTYQVVQIAEEEINKRATSSKDLVDYLIETLGRMGGIEGWIPNYQRNFNKLMKDILNCETSPGKLYS